MTTTRRLRLATTAVVAVLAVLPFAVAGRISLGIFVFIGLFSLIVIGLSLLAGHAGQVSLGQAAFYGLGAYIAAITTLRMGLAPWLALPGGGRRGSRRLRAGRAHLRPAGSLPGTGHPGTECGDGRAGPQRTGSDGRAHRTDGDPPSFDWRTRDRRGSSLLLSHLVLRARCALAGPQSGVLTSRTRAGRRPQ